MIKTGFKLGMAAGAGVVGFAIVLAGTLVVCEELKKALKKSIEKDEGKNNEKGCDDDACDIGGNDNNWSAFDNDDGK
jgi:hypothetical protein